MAITGEVLINSKKLDNLRRRLKKLAKVKLETGHFSESGIHPDANITYSELAQRLASATPSRDLRVGVTMHFANSSFKNRIIKSTKDYIIHSKPINKQINYVGSYLNSYARSLFGVPNSFYNPSNADWWAELKGGDTPMLFEGYLKDSWAFRSNLDGQIRYDAI